MINRIRAALVDRYIDLHSRTARALQADRSVVLIQYRGVRVASLLPISPLTVRQIIDFVLDKIGKEDGVSEHALRNALARTYFLLRRGPVTTPEGGKYALLCQTFPRLRLRLARIQVDLKWQEHLAQAIAGFVSAALFPDRSSAELRSALREATTK